MRRALCWSGIAIAVQLLVGAVAPSGQYTYTTTRGFLTMPDGVRLAVTWWRPTPKAAGEQFPVLLELLPYRKDDSFYQRDFPLYDYFVKRGFILAKVDIRGTGGSDGHLPDREYSDQELADATEIIAQLVRIPGSNGNVGMWGISWGGFNALQVAMLEPPSLNAIIALHASDDLFHDDVRYIDGGLHMDPYTIEIDHENALPRTPDYPLDSAYFKNRFESYPWVLTYMKQPVDGPFWRKHALRWNYDAIKIPTYLIGGLLDGYRDTPIRALDQLRAPVKVEIGPWNHAWPDDGDPGPNYEWRARAVEWWNHWLRGQETRLLDERRFLTFVRDGHPPDATRDTTPGYWRFSEWPVPGTRWERWNASQSGRLEKADSTTPTASSASSALRYVPSSGTTAGDWWGEPTGDMRRDDAGSLVWDSPVLTESFEIIGMPIVRLRVTPGAPLVTWTARIEDVLPDGQVSLVGGGLINGTQVKSTTSPERMRPGETYDIEIPIHFTTWTYRPGHRVRLSVSNAQFPMVWPSPDTMTTVFHLDGGAASVTLPVVPSAAATPAPLPASEPREERPDVKDLTIPGYPSQVVSYSTLTGVTSVDWKVGYGWMIGATRLEVRERQYYETNDNDPAASRFLGEESHRIRVRGRNLLLETSIDILSDRTTFHATVTRRISENGKLVRKKQWKEEIAREYH